MKIITRTDYTLFFKYLSAILGVMVISTTELFTPFETADIFGPTSNMDADHPFYQSSIHNHWPPVSELPSVKELPDLLTMFNGSPVTSLEMWNSERRPELIDLFYHYMYGKPPPPPDYIEFTLDDIDQEALNGRATRKLITLKFGPEKTPTVSLLLVVPNATERPVPVILGLNFGGNYTTFMDPAIPLTDAWVPEARDHTGRKEDEINRSHEDQRGLFMGTFWHFDRAIERGYAVATLYAGEISPDYNSGFTEGVHKGYFSEGQSRPGPHEWGVISAWAWGLQRAVDYLILDEDVDRNAIIVTGWSRLGKAAMLAGATDERIAITIPHQAGAGGTSPARSEIGESVADVNRFLHWFTETYKEFGDQVHRLPFDQHALIALVAPRPVLLTNASEDEWADPVGQFDMLIAASIVYELYGVEGISTTNYPPTNELINSRLGYFVRPGPHDQNHLDWEVWMDFCDIHLGYRQSSD